jgi:hypothetical protein
MAERNWNRDDYDERNEPRNQERRARRWEGGREGREFGGDAWANPGTRSYGRQAGYDEYDERYAPGEYGRSQREGGRYGESSGRGYESGRGGFEGGRGGWNREETEGGRGGWSRGELEGRGGYGGGYGGDFERGRERWASESGGSWGSGRAEMSGPRREHEGVRTGYRGPAHWGEEARTGSSAPGGFFAPGGSVAGSETWGSYGGGAGWGLGTGAIGGAGYARGPAYGGGPTGASHGGYAGGFGGATMERREGPFRGRGPKGYRRSDDRIKEDVSERLRDDPDVDASEIEVEVHEGEVTLTGTVASRREKRAAADCAEDVSGVEDVNNRLRIQKDRSDEPGRSGAGSSSSRGNATQAPRAGQTHQARSGSTS